MENWPLIVALSRFGQFADLTTSRSPEFEHIAPVDSWTFYGSRYASPYLSFVPVEQYSNVLVNAKANPDARESYRKLQQLTPAQQALFARYDKTRSTPFLDFGNHAAQTGAGPAAMGPSRRSPADSAAVILTSAGRIRRTPHPDGMSYLQYNPLTLHSMSRSGPRSTSDAGGGQ